MLQAVSVPRQPRVNFNKRGQLICGSLQIVLGCLAFVLAIGSILLKAGSILYLMGAGFYCGVLMAIAGGLGVGSSFSGNTCPIIGCLVMSVFSTIAGLTYFGISAAATGLDEGNRQTHAYYVQQERSSSSIFRTDNPEAAIVVDVFAMLVGLTDLCVAIAQIVICSRTTCCAPYQGQQPRVIFIQQPYPDQQNAMQVAPTGYHAQPVPGQPPPPYIEKV